MITRKTETQVIPPKDSITCFAEIVSYLLAH